MEGHPPITQAKGREPPTSLHMMLILVEKPGEGEREFRHADEGQGNASDPELCVPSNSDRISASLLEGVPEAS